MFNCAEPADPFGAIDAGPRQLHAYTVLTCVACAKRRSRFAPPFCMIATQCCRYRLLVVAAAPVSAIATVRSTTATVGLARVTARRRVVRWAMACVGTRPTRIGVHSGRARSTASAQRLPAVGMSAGNYAAASAVVTSPTVIHKAMGSPAVAITPAGPWAHAQEDAIVEIS